jgi:hypothetical protein
VLRELPETYTVIDVAEEASLDFQSFSVPMQQRSQIATLVQQGLQYLLAENLALANPSTPDKLGINIPSNWFG